MLWFALGRNTFQLELDGMSKLSVGQRARRGAMEGAATGLAVALVRAGLKLFRDGFDDDWATQLPAIGGYFAFVIVGSAYLFAIGRVIADGVFGSIIGATIVGVCGLFVGTSFSSDPFGPPYPMLVAGVAGAVVGAPLGALIQQKVFQGRPPSGELPSQPDTTSREENREET